MQKITIYISLIFILSYSNEKNSNNNNSADTSSTARKNDSTKRASNPESTIINFLNWYKENEQIIGKIELINNFTASFDSTKFYSINFDNTNKYLNLFVTSGFVSNTYVKKWQDYFIESDKVLKANPQNDGVPDGFDYTFVMCSQDWDDALKQLDKIKIVKKEIRNNNATVIVHFNSEIYSNYQLEYNLTYVNNIWLIDEIKNATKL